MQTGAFVISLDFELHWGVRDTASTGGPYRANLLGARDAVPSMLDLFDRYGVAATWATVGMLFARDREEWLFYQPEIRPAYQRPQDNPYGELVGHTERDDPFHYASSLVDLIRSCPRQEMATHTYSHYYCLDPGHTPEAFAADLRSAIAIARSRNINFRSIVFPRMQVPVECLPILRSHGIVCWRGTERSWMYQAASTREMRSWKRRLARIADAYFDLAGPETFAWKDIPAEGMFCVRQSRFLRPYSPAFALLEPLRLKRITNAMEHAARRNEIFHLCWHPHNFGVNLNENLAVLGKILETHRRLNSEYGLRSLSMWETACQSQPATAPQAAGGSG